MTSEMWFQSESGIRRHYREQRETERRLHDEKMIRLGEDEDAFLDAFRATNRGRFEIRVIGTGDSTSSGTLELPKEEAVALFEQDAATLSPGARIELIDLDADQIIRHEQN